MHLLTSSKLFLFIKYIQNIMTEVNRSANPFHVMNIHRFSHTRTSKHIHTMITRKHFRLCFTDVLPDSLQAVLESRFLSRTHTNKNCAQACILRLMSTCCILSYPFVYFHFQDRHSESRRHQEGGCPQL